MAAMLTLLPILIGLAGGFLLRRLGLVDQHDGESVFKLVFYVFGPAVTFSSLARTHLDLRLAIYPAAAVAIIAAGYLASRVVAAKARLDPTRAAVVVSCCMVVNTAFQLPFVQLLYSAAGVARIAAFDLVNTVVTFTLAYLAAARGNPAKAGGRIPLARLLTNPAIYAVAAGLTVNVAGVTVPAAIVDPIATVGAATAVVLPVGVGILFNPIGQDLGLATLMVVTRLITGLGVAAALVVLFGLSGVDRTVLLLIGAGPLVFAGVAFASLEKLDVRLATTALSLSLIVSVIVTPLIILVTH